VNLELTIRFMNFLLGTRTVPFFAQSRSGVDRHSTTPARPSR